VRSDLLRVALRWKRSFGDELQVEETISPDIMLELFLEPWSRPQFCGSKTSRKRSLEGVEWHAFTVMWRSSSLVEERV